MSGMTLEKLQVLIEAETKPFREELGKMQNQLKSATNNVEKETSRIKKSFSSVKTAIVSLGIGAALYKVGRDSLKFASDLQEVQNVVDTSFGKMSYKAEEFAKNAIYQFGMSELSAKRTSGTYMAMARGIGLGLNDASNMAIQLAKLSGDVASFFNISQSEAAVKLQSVFTGETETLKQLGVVMTQTNLKQYAMDHGLSSNIESMDQASLTMLRYMFVMDQLKLAQGDFAKTSGSWANQIRILQEQWKQLTGIIGNGLIAMLTPVIRVINTVLQKIIQFANAIQSVFSSLFGKKGKESNKSTKQMQQSLGGAEANAGGLNRELDKTAGKAKKASKAMGQLASIDEINNMSKPNGGTSGTPGTSGLSGLSGGLSGFGGSVEEPDTSGIDKAVEKIKNKMLELYDFLKKYKVPIVSAMAGIVASLATLWTIRNWTSLIAPIQGVFLWLSNLVKVLAVGPAGWQALITGATGVAAPFVAIAGIIGVVTASLVYLWQTSEEFRNNVIGALQALMDVLNNVYVNVLQPIFAFLMDVFNTILTPIAMFLSTVVVTAVDLVANVILSMWKNILAPIANFLVDILSIALKGVIKIWESWKPAIEVVYGAIQWIWDTILKPLVDWIKDTLIKGFEELGEFIDILLPHITDMFQFLIDFLVNVFTGQWDEKFGLFGVILTDFYDIVKEVIAGATVIFSNIIDFINNVFKGNWKGAWESVKNIFKSIWDSLVGIVSTVWNKILKLFSNGGKIFSGIADGISKVFKNIVNNLIKGINRVISIPFNKINSILNNIRSISIMGLKPFSGLWGRNPLPVPRIPLLARGAIATHAMPAIFGEAGAEAVVPLENNTGWMSKIAKGITGHMGSSYDLGDDINDLIIISQEMRDLLMSILDKDTDVYLDSEKISNRLDDLARFRRLRTG